MVGLAANKAHMTSAELRLVCTMHTNNFYMTFRRSSPLGMRRMAKHLFQTGASLGNTGTW